MLIVAGEVKLEASLWQPENGTPVAAGLMCHPHPLYGGTMNNRVIYRAAKGAVAAGLTVLRFNFRGVGKSSGSYERGAGERKDVAVLLDWLQAHYPDLPLALCGFSFGSWVGLQVACCDSRVQALAGIGLPVDSYDFEFLVENRTPSRFIIGTQDQFCARTSMAALERRLPPSSTVRWIDGADHMFTRQADQVQVEVEEFFREQFRGHSS